MNIHNGHRLILVSPFVLLIITMASLQECVAQNSLMAKTIPLSVGDRLPETFLPNLLNHKDTSTNTASFEGRWLILNFMSIACMKTVNQLPAFYRLQQDFKEKITILLVTPNTRETYFTLSASFRNTRKPSDTMLLFSKFPTLLKGNILREYFPYKKIAHIVWIDPGGIVRAITGAEYLTAPNINTIITNPSINWPVKADKAIPVSQSSNRTKQTANLFKP